MKNTRILATRARAWLRSLCRPQYAKGWAAKTLVLLWPLLWIMARLCFLARGQNGGRVPLSTFPLVKMTGGEIVCVCAAVRVIGKSGRLRGFALSKRDATNHGYVGFYSTPGKILDCDPREPEDPTQKALRGLTEELFGSQYAHQPVNRLGYKCRWLPPVPIWGGFRHILEFRNGVVLELPYPIYQKVLKPRGFVLFTVENLMDNDVIPFEADWLIWASDPCPISRFFKYV